MNIQNITFKQLRAFVVVAEEQSFARAAFRLHLTPSALTSAIKALERTTGLRFFDRSTRSVHLTVHAQEFLPIAQRLLQDLSDALDNLQDKASVSSGSVVIAGATSFMAYVVTPAVTTFARSSPGVRVRLVGASTAESTRSVLEGEADFAVTTLTAQHLRDSELDATLLLSDRLGVVFSRHHDFAKQSGGIMIRALAAEKYVSLNRQNGVRMLIDADSRLPDPCRRPVYEVSEVPLLSPLLEHQVGIALLPSMAARPIIGEHLMFRPLRMPIWRHLYFIRRRGRTLSPAADHLAQLIFKELRELLRDPQVTADPLKARAPGSTMLAVVLPP